MNRALRASVAVAMRLALVTSVLCATLLAAPSTAEAGPRPSISPLRIAVDGLLAAGGTLTLPPIVLQNSGDERGEFRLIVTSFADQPDGVPPAEWFDGLAEAVLLEPGDKRQIDLTLRVPQAASRGDYSGLILAERIPERGARGATSVNLAVATVLTFTVEAGSPALLDDPLAWFDGRAPLSYAGLGLLALAAAYVLLKSPAHALGAWRAATPRTPSRRRITASPVPESRGRPPVGWLSHAPASGPFTAPGLATADSAREVNQRGGMAAREASGLRSLTSLQAWRLATFALLALAIAMGALIALGPRGGGGGALNSVDGRLDELSRDVGAIFYELENLRSDVSNVSVQPREIPRAVGAPELPQLGGTSESTDSSTPAPQVEPARPIARTTEMVVERGDTAIAIAREYGVSIGDLAAANGRSEESLSALRAGETLKLPAVAP